MARGYLAGAGLGLAASVVTAGALSLAVGFPDEGAEPRDTMSAADQAATSDAETAERPADAAATDTAAAPSAETPQPEPAPADTEDAAETSDAAEPTDSAQAETAESPAEPVDPPAPARRPEAERQVARTETGALDAPQDARDADVAGGDTTPAALPEAEQDSAALSAPTAPDSPGGVEVGTDAPVMTAPSVDGPAAPRPEARPSVATEPAQPPAPVVPEEDSALVADPAEETAPAPETAGSPDDTTAETAEDAGTPNSDAQSADVAPETASDDSEEPSDTADADSSDLPTELPPELADPTEAPADDAVADAAPDAQSALPEPDAPDAEAAPEAPATEDAAPEIAAAESGPDQAAPDAPPEVDSTAPTADAPDRPEIGEPAGTLTDREGAVPVRRLGADDGTGDDVDSGAEDADTPPLRRFAAEPVAAEDQPLMSVVLIDDGSGPLGPDALDTFPFPVSFAVDPDMSNAEARMAAYRDRGFEVLVLSRVPEGASPSDVEVALEAALTAVPEAVGVMEAPEGGLQSSRAVSDQVTEILADTGHGLVMLPNGLNTAQRLAERAGVPSASVFRDFDGEAQSPTDQRRMLESAAFRARQDGPVVMLGRLRADTVSALLLWSLQDRGTQVALVPVSQLLRDGTD